MTVGEATFWCTLIIVLFAYTLAPLINSYFEQFNK